MKIPSIGNFVMEDKQAHRKFTRLQGQPFSFLCCFSVNFFLSYSLSLSVYSSVTFLVFKITKLTFPTFYDDCLFTRFFHIHLSPPHQSHSIRVFFFNPGKNFITMKLNFCYKKCPYTFSSEIPT